ncbi:hypothetical protein DRJ22_03600 [Candidatus Woesearchaeota archaeon]|nr:MAG: hypothetical protein B6U93_00255 [Candidatus Woesearchaeota archaeon ex4484_78]RLE45787.1 MAG: hypothetical protein DRJ22_03600 [Candidatus Woesearchaeota archaeon]
MKFFYFVLLLLLLTSCYSSTHAKPRESVSGVFSHNVSNAQNCPYGYKPDTHECLSKPSFGVDEAFGSDSEITPPSTPI